MERAETMWKAWREALLSLQAKEQQLEHLRQERIRLGEETRQLRSEVQELRAQCADLCSQYETISHSK